MARIRVINPQGKSGTIDDSELQIALSSGYTLPTQESKGFVGNLISSLVSPFKRTGQRVVGAYEELRRKGEVDEAERLLKEAERRMMAGDTSPEVKTMLDRAQALSSNASRSTLANREPLLGDPLQIAKDTAATLSWGIPAKGVGTLGKTASRAIGGGAAGFGYSPKTSFEGLVGSTLGGAGTSVLTGAILDKLFPGKVPAKETVTDIVPEEKGGIKGWVGKQGTAMKKANQAKLIGSSPKKYGGDKLLESLDEHGIKIGVNVKDADDLAVAAGNLLKENSDEIQRGLQELKKRGVKIRTDKIFDAVDDKISKQGLTSAKANMARVKQELVESLGGERVPADPDLFYKIKYNAGGKGKWGALSGISQEESAAWQAVNSAANETLNETLKQAGYSNLLNNNKAISTAMDAISWASDAGSQVAKSPWGFYETISTAAGLAGGGLPGAATNIAINKALTSPTLQYKAGTILEKLGGRGTTQAAQVSQTPIRNLLSSVAGAVPPALPAAATRNISGATTAVSTTTVPTTTAGISQSGTTQPQGAEDILSMLGLDLQSLMLLQSLPVKEQNAILADLIGSKIKGEKSGISGKDAALAESGISSLGRIRSMLQKDPNLLLKQSLIPGKLASRDFDRDLFGAVEALLRLRSGAAVPESEVRRYMRSYGPSLGDSYETAMNKINLLEQDFQYLLQ